jgi:lysophospholipase L1-like esterase
MKRFKKFLFNLAIIVASFLILEFGDRALKKLWPEDSFKRPGAENLAFDVNYLSPYSFFGDLPSLELRPNDNFFYEFDGKKVSAQKDQNEFRIFILGGSVAQGYGASTPDKKFYKILEKKLNEEKPKFIKKIFNVISAGRLGYVSGQELALLINGILDFKPDMTLHLNGANEMIAVSQYHESPGYPFYFQSLKEAFEATKLERKLDQTLGESVFLSDLKNMLKKYKTSSIDLMKKNIARHYNRNMQTSAQILNANGIDAYFFLQPLLQFKSQTSSTEKKFIKTFPKQGMTMWKSTYPLLEKSLKGISKSTGIKWKSLKNVFNKEEKTVFTDSVHLTNLGQTLLAEIIFQEIKETLFMEER